MKFNVKNGTAVFNNKSTYVEGWYWAMPSHKLKKGKAVGLEFLGSQVLLYRGESGRVVAMDPYCPHMGAHFKEGKVVGDQVVCAFHGWKFNEKGKCTDIPCKKYSDKTDIVPVQRTYPAAEKYGLIWIYSGTNVANHPIPHFPALEGHELEIYIGPPTFRPCRPEVVMLNAIDAHHFNTVHPEAALLASVMDLQAIPLSPHAIRLQNQSGVPHDSFVGKLLAPFYKTGVLTYFLDYWYGSTAAVQLGPDFLQVYLFFPHRPTNQGGTEGAMVFLAKRPKGIFGKLVGKTLAFVTYIVGSYFEKGDREIFDSIRFEMRAPVKADHPIIGFIRHAEQQVTHPMGTLVRGEDQKTAAAEERASS